MTPWPEVDLEVILPAFNEAHRLSASLDTLSTALGTLPVTSAITVVDNASTDGTTALLAERQKRTGDAPVRVLSCTTRGKGAAVRAGMLASTARWVGFMDTDLATSLDALDLTVEKLASGSQIVVGSRRHDMSNLLLEQQLVRRLGGWAYRRAAELVVPGLLDTQCGFKFFELQTARALFKELTLVGWSFDVEVLAKAQALGISLAEVPVSWTNQSGSRFRPIRDGVGAFRDLALVRSAVRRHQMSGVLSPVLDTAP
jgi:glycosyltransferase involved in cell wall biosynthesis